VDPGALHHLELWVDDLDCTEQSFGWLLPRLGFSADGRMRSGLNHIAFVAGSRADVDAIAVDAPAHGWTLMFADRHPFAGGDDHYAAYLENDDGFEVELVAAP
jgi:catechol 2,3-dioxygenase-like lactoylglutathione lyase family enzyme